MVVRPGPWRALLLALLVLAPCHARRGGRKAKAAASCFHAAEMRPGRCELLTKCPFSIRERQQGGRPQLCGFSRTDLPGRGRVGPIPIVCCPSESKARQEEAGDKPLPPQSCENLQATSAAGESAAERKCTEYARAACAMAAPRLTASAPSDGEPADRLEFPHMALLGYGPDRASLAWLCGGSLISDSWVLTAAHCLGNARGRVSHVLLGALGRAEAGGGGEAAPERQLLAVAEAVPHPEYAVKARYHDVALLRLASPAALSRRGVRPACLHTDQDGDPEGLEAVATGWGATGFGEDVSEVLIKVNLTIRPQRDCQRRFNERTDPQLRSGFYEGQLCAGGNSKRDTCQGDSGGPLQVAAAGGSCLHRVVGIVSYGPSCGIGLPGVYTRVAHYVPWIESVAWRHEGSTCAGSAPRLPDTGNGTLARRACRSFLLDWCPGVGPLAMQPGRTASDACHFGAAVGEATDILDFPHMALLVYGDDYHNEEVGCLASLISPRYLLTAARCTRLRCLPLRRALLGVTGGRETLGRHYRSRNRQEVAVAEAVVHPEYAADRRHHDVALLRLARPVTLSALVRPACLHTPRHGPEWGLRAAATGWEASGHWQSVRGELRKSQLTVRPPQECRQAVPSLKDSQLCAGGTCPNSTFPGEPGGPLQVLHLLLDGQDGQRLSLHRLLGVASLAPPCGRCLPDVYSRVAAFVPWIESVVWPDAAAP